MNSSTGADADLRSGIAQFYHNNFERGQEHRLANIKRKNNSSKTHSLMGNRALCNQVRLLLSDVRSVRDAQGSSESTLSALQVDNKSLWRDVSVLRSQHHKQRRVIERIFHFLSSLVNNRNSVVGKKHKMRLMINATTEATSVSMCDPASVIMNTEAGELQVSPSRVSMMSSLKGESGQQFAQSFYQSGGHEARSYESSFGSNEIMGSSQTLDFNTSGAFQNGGEQQAYLNVSSGFAQHQQHHQQQHQLQPHSHGIQVAAGNESFNSCAGTNEQQMIPANGYRTYWLQQQQQQLPTNESAALGPS